MTPSTAGTATVRRMRSDDVDRVVAIESEAFTSPWKAETFHTLLDRPGAVMLVLETADAGVAGYAVLWCILDQGELANIAVSSALRGRGLGTFLLLRVLEVARERGVESLYLEVRVSNTKAADLYRRHGFTDVGIRKRYYDAPTEDAILMVARL